MQAGRGPRGFRDGARFTNCGSAAGAIPGFGRGEVPPNRPVPDRRGRVQGACRRGADPAGASVVVKVSTMAIGVDFLMVVSGFLCAYWLRFSSGLIPAYTEQDSPVLPSGYLASGYWKLILLGSLVVLLGLLSKDMSRLEDLLCPRRIRARLAGVVVTCLAAFLGLSLAVRTTPPIPRMFVLCAAACVPLAVYGWRALLAAALRRPLLSKYLRQRVLLVGCNGEVCRIHKSVLTDARGSVEFVGCLRGRKANGNGNGACQYVSGNP